MRPNKSQYYCEHCIYQTESMMYVLDVLSSAGVTAEAQGNCCGLVFCTRGRLQDADRDLRPGPIHFTANPLVDPTTDQVAFFQA